MYKYRYIDLPKLRYVYIRTRGVRTDATLPSMAPVWVALILSASQPLSAYAEACGGNP
eukprot:COSAG02_NODE_47762_length_338_cov_12.962343_1_plen_57_part_01